MVQTTVARLGNLVPCERILIVTAERLVQPIREALPQLPPSAILGEPCKRDTAPCIALAACWLLHQDPEATMVVMPADHVIQPESGFQQAVHYAAELVQQDPHSLVTFGITPTYPAESFGYIERGEPLDHSADQPPTYRVLKFREKPKAHVAQQYLESGTFYWNAGIFVWKARTILAELTLREPELVRRIEAIRQSMGTDHFAETFAAEFAAAPAKSIDYAVMEHTRNAVVIESPFQWDDVGSWQSLPRLLGADAHGNTIDAKHLGIRTEGTIVRGERHHLIVTLGLQDCLIVQTPDATLVAKKHEEESIREIVKQLEELGWQEYL